MVAFLGEQGYNLYAYAPKQDPLHRDRWREPYLREELSRFTKLAEQCRDHGLEFLFGISPWQFHYSDAADLECLWQKLLTMYQRGIRSFALLVDDMPDRFHHADDGERFGSLAEAQSWLANTVYQRLEALGELRRFVFCPTEYCGEGASPYLQTLGKELQPAIDVFWTGTEVCAQFLRSEDARKVAATLRRPVLYWDNYPVNDGAMQWRPHLRPVRGRDADLGEVSRGIVVNAALQPEACKIPLYTYGAFLREPIGYEPEAAWLEALRAVAGDQADADAVAVLGDTTRWACIERGKALYSSLGHQVVAFWQRWGGAPAESGPDLKDLPPAALPEGSLPGSTAQRRGAIAALAAELDRLQQAADRLQGPMANPLLKADLAPWIEKLTLELAAARPALAVLRATLNGDGEVDDLRQAVADASELLQRHPYWVAGALLDQFARRCLWAADELVGGR